jgi:glycosyltransferase involved in cell wall biosynthesis
VKVFIQTEKFKGGPAVFRSRIIDCFNKMDGVSVTTDINNKFDVELCFIRRIFKHKKPYVLRADGCYYITLIDNNLSLKESIEKSAFTIYQSEFSRQMCQDILGVNVRSTVIYNGIDQKYIDSIPKNAVIEPGSFISVSNRWRDNKRPDSTINGFLEADTKRHLYIVGEGIKNSYNSQYIHLLGTRPEKEIISIMKSCDYQIHLCHIDSCPNAVIEGLCSGLNVLCTNLGGTRELVKNNGVVLDVDGWERKKMRKRKLDSLDPSIVAGGIRKLMEIKERPSRADLDIYQVAVKYFDILAKVMRE